MSEANPYLPPEASLADEHVDDGEELAPLGRRLGASMLDGVIVGVFIWAGVFALGRADAFDGGDSSFKVLAAIAVGGTLLYLLLHGYFLKRDGQTIGKKVLGIKVTMLNGDRPGLARLVFIRYLPVTALALVPFIGPLISLVDSLLVFRSDRRCAHDLIAGTRVVRVRKAG
jgi:uncharacterized RDD family membrane protein YckC